MLSFHLYEKPAPQYGKAAPIQKGLVPSLQGGGADLIEEGLGLGVPILQYWRDFYFAGSAKILLNNLQKTNWAKTFCFNLIERHYRKPSQGISLFSWTVPRLHNFIYRFRTGREFLKLVAILNHLIGKARTRVSYQAHFIPVTSRGESHVKYSQSGQNEIRIEISFDTVVRNNLQQIYVSNELGGTLFTEYYDSTDLHLVDGAIEPWARIRGRWVIFYAPKLDLGFRVEIPQGITAYRGREVLEEAGIFWSGVIFQLPKSVKRLSYRVWFGQLNELKEAAM